MTDETISEIIAVGKEAEAQIEAATYAYVKMGNPKPNRVKVTLWHIVTQFGPDVLFQFIALVGGAYISANRIGVLMEIAQANLIAKFNQSNIEIQLGGNQATFRVMAMMAFEGALIAAGLYEGGRMTEKKQDPWAERTAFAVTAIGGFMSSITLQSGAGAEFIAYWAGWIFSIITAVAASVVVRYTAKNMGFLWVAILNLQETFDRKWKDLLQEWQGGFESYFPEFKQQNFGRSFKARLTKNDPNAPAPQERKNNDEEVQVDLTGVSDRLRDAINRAGLLPTEVGDGLRMTPSQIADYAIPPLSKQERKQLHAILNRFRGQVQKGTWSIPVDLDTPVEE